MWEGLSEGCGGEGEAQGERWRDEGETQGDVRSPREGRVGEGEAQGEGETQGERPRGTCGPQSAGQPDDGGKSIAQGKSCFARHSRTQPFIRLYAPHTQDGKSCFARHSPTPIGAYLVVVVPGDD